MSEAEQRAVEIAALTLETIAKITASCINVLEDLADGDDKCLEPDDGWRILRLNEAIPIAKYAEPAHIHVTYPVNPEAKALLTLKARQHGYRHSKTPKGDVCLQADNPVELWNMKYYAAYAAAKTRAAVKQK